MSAIYNEFDAYPAAWIRNLIAANLVAPGVVDGRSIKELTPADVAGSGQRHFFAGIGVWSLALRMAGVPDDASVWTGSCPCQPWSVAGKQGGASDERHLWPEWFQLIREHLPSVVLGEQVASRAGLGWFDNVRTDLESCGYAVGMAVLPAASVGAPHIRNRIFFGAALADGVGYAGSKGLDQQLRNRGALCEAASAEVREAPSRASVGATQPGGPWSDAVWLPCRDGKARPTQPGVYPLADGTPPPSGRNARLRQRHRPASSRHLRALLPGGRVMSADDIATALKALRAARTAHADTLRTVERVQWREEVELLNRAEASMRERLNARAVRPVFDNTKGLA